MDIALTNDMRRNLYLLDAVQKSRNIRLRREASKYHWHYLYLGPVLMGLSFILGLGIYVFGAIAVWVGFFSATGSMGQVLLVIVAGGVSSILGLVVMLIGEFFCDRVDDKMYKFKCENGTVNNLRDLEVEYAKALTESIEPLSGVSIVTESVSHSLSKYAFYRQEGTLDGERVFFSFDYTNGMLKVTPTPATIKNRTLVTAS